MLSTFTAIIDANVFYKTRLRSLILWQAQTGLFRARWTEQIHDEWMRNLIANDDRQTKEKLEKTRRDMDAAVDDCLVTGFEGLIDSVTLPDPGDRHVLAAAIVARANLIVTFNLKDFPEKTLDTFGLHATHPDEFLLDVAALDPVLFAEMAGEDFRHYVNPPLLFENYIDSLRRDDVPKTAKYLGQLQVMLDPPKASQ